MANLYPYFGAGEWETYGNNIEYQTASQQRSSLQRSVTVAHAGAASGKFTILQNAQLSCILKSSFVDNALNTRPIVLTAGKVYKLSAWVYNDAVNPIGSDDMPICIGPYANPGVNPTGSLLRSIQYTTVGASKGVWQQIFCTWKEGNSDSTSLSKHIKTVPTGHTGYQGAVPPAGNMLVGGIMYIDDITLEEETTCDLTIGIPAYTKTDETAVNADDGTITINATSSFAREYSLTSAAGPWQLSNIFTGKAPGVYTAYIRDANPAGCSAQINNIIILEFNAPPPPPPVVPGVLTLDSRPINEGNFITWFNSTGDTAFNSMAFTECYWDLPNAYRINKRVGRHYPVVCNAEVFSFYINMKTDYSYPNFSSLRLNLIKTSGNVQSDIATLERVFATDNINYFIYASVTLVGVTPGYYRLAIVDTSDANRILFTSNEIEVMTQDKAKKYTARFQYRNSSIVFRFLYDNILEYLNRIRIRVNVLSEDTDGEIKQYRAITTGRLRNVNYELDKFYAFETYFFDDLAHRAVEVLQIHDTILINDRYFIVKSLYKVEWSVSRYVNKGRLEMYEQAFSTANRYGSQTAAGIDDVGPYLLGDNGGKIKL